MAQLYFNGLCCDKTTENGEDEVYILVAGLHSDGSRFTHRVPGDAAHWDMNDGQNDHNHCVHNVVLVNRDIADGQSLELLISIMEEDGGTSGPYQQAFGDLLISTGNPYAIAAGTFISIMGKFLPFHDSDDWIGTFAVRIINQSGNLSVEWRPVDRVSGVIHGIHGPNTCEFRMNGDGSNYVGWYGVRP